MERREDPEKIMWIIHQPPEHIQTLSKVFKVCKNLL